MNVVELANKLQDLAHEGWSHNEVYIRVYEALYKINDIHKTTVGNVGSDDNDKIFFELEAKPLAAR
jgi:hypothetical protein